MAVLRSTVNRASGHSYATKLRASVEGGPALAAALRRLEEDMRVTAAKAAVEAMGEPLVREWQARLPVGPPPIHISEAVEARVTKTKTGANGTISVRRVPGAGSEDQPAQYERKLEFGGHGAAAQPSARPAFDIRKQEAVDAAERVLRAHVARAGR